MRADIIRHLHESHRDYMDVRLPQIIDRVVRLIESTRDPAIGDQARLVLSELSLFEHDLRKHTLFEEKFLNSLSGSTDLSEREKETLAALARGLSNKQIADTLHISPHTVISHRKNIVRKTGIKTLPGLTVYALMNHLVSQDELV